MKLQGLLPARYRVTTEPLRSERRIELAAVLLLLLLCLQLLYSGARFATLSLPRAISPAADALHVGEVTPAGQVSAEQSQEILARPLFWEGRRPTDQEVAAAVEQAEAAKAGKLKGVTLLGVFGGGDTAGIIIRIKDKKRRVMLGEEVNGWTLDAVEANRVEFTASGRTRSLVLRPRAIAAAEPAKTRAAPRSGGKTPPVDEAGEDQLSLGGRRTR